MAGAKDVQARRPLLTIWFLSLLISGNADFAMPSMNNVHVGTTSDCHVCGTVTPSPGNYRNRASAAAGLTTGPPTGQALPNLPPQGPGENFEQAQGPRQRVYDDAVEISTTPAPKQWPGASNGLNIPMIAGLATGGAVVAGGVIATAVAYSKHRKDQERQQQVSGGVSGSAATPTPHPLASTFLAASVAKGATNIQVMSIIGFAVGDTIQVGSEYNAVQGFARRLAATQGSNSIIELGHPMNAEQSSGSAVRVIHEPANAQVQTTLAEQALDQVLGNVVSTTVAAAAPTFMARESGQPSVATGQTGNTSGKTLFWSVLAGIILCCCFWCLVMVVSGASGFMSKRPSKEASRYAGLSDGEEAESEEEEEEESLEEEDDLEEALETPSRAIEKS